MRWESFEDVIEEFEEYFRDKSDELKDLLINYDEESGDGILDEERNYSMYDFDAIESFDSYLDAVQAGADGEDEYGGSFQVNKEYYYYNNWGDLVSTDEYYRDFDPWDYIDDDVIEDIYDYKDRLDLPKFIEKLFDEWEDSENEDEGEE
jgi:hypothetical protein